MTNEAFQQQVIADLAELKTQMHSLIGNGQPGRITRLEDSVTAQGTTINKIIGGLIGLNALLGVGVALAHHFRA